MIRLVNVSMRYPKSETLALDKVSLRVEKGEFVFIVGHSGSGKSTLSKILTGELKPTEGRAVVNDFSIGTMKKKHIPILRRSLGIVFQDFRLIDKKTIYENVAFGMRVTAVSEKLIDRRVKMMLELVGLTHKMHERPDQISGGEKQRVAIARALVNNPKIIIADEPTGNLDPEKSVEIMTLLKKINDRGITVVVITHEEKLVDTLKKRVILIDKGTIKEDKETSGYIHEENEQED